MDTDDMEDTEPEDDDFLDEELLAVLTQPKRVALAVLAELRVQWEIGNEAKRRHDLLVRTARTLRKDFADVKPIEQRGKKATTKVAQATS